MAGDAVEVLPATGSAWECRRAEGIFCSPEDRGATAVAGVETRFLTEPRQGLDDLLQVPPTVTVEWRIVEAS